MLLDEIIDLAADNKQSLTVLLRKCIILAHELNNQRLKAWANSELTGYANIDEMPEYRVIPAQAKGNFMGPAGAYQRERNLPAIVLEEKHRWAAETVHLMDPVSAYESAISAYVKPASQSKPGGRLVFEWNNNMVLYYQQKFIPGWALVSAWQEVPPGAIVGVLDTIRNRVLNMALEIKSELGEKSGHPQRITAREASKVDHAITTNIYGGNVYIAAGHSQMTASTVQQQNICIGDWEHLQKVLRTSGIADTDLDELSEAVSADGRKLGDRVKRWISRNASKVVSSGVAVGTSVGQALLLEYLKQYLGIK